MSGFLIDMCVLSELQKPKPNASVVSWMSETDVSLLYLSAVTIGEIRRGIDLLDDRRRRDGLESWFVAEILGSFSEHILPFDGGVAQRWGSIRAVADRSGVRLPVLDAIVAATALHNNLTVATRNERDFRRSGVAVFNPWS